MKLKTIIYLATLWFSLVACAQSGPPPTSIDIEAQTVVNGHYLGNGVQWDPYELNYGDTILEISDADWDKLYDRLSYMRPGLIRVMVNSEEYFTGERINESAIPRVARILHYCQENKVQVMFGDWGGGLVDSQNDRLGEDAIRQAAILADYLITTRGFTCIKWYNLINEPNGFWSSTDGKYALWARAIDRFQEELTALGLGALPVVGPDAAIWTTGETWWVDSCNTMNTPPGLYDIHTYPSKSTVNSGAYEEIVSAYRERVPEGKHIVMGEIGFKYVSREDSLLNVRNTERARAKPYASVEDSQMSVYDTIYGTDMADALIQTVNAGYSGAIVWMLDDAIHSKEAPDKLKVWGFWNILGDEYFGAEEETVRPWYYAWTLLSRNMPPGCQVLLTHCPEGDLRAMTVRNDDQYMVAVVNIGEDPETFVLKGSSLPELKGTKRYTYSAGTIHKEGDHELTANDTLDLVFDGTQKMTIPANGMVVLTTIED